MGIGWLSSPDKECDKPRRAKVKLTRTVTGIAVVLLDRDGSVEEVEEVQEEFEWCDAEIHSVLTVLSVHP